MKVEEGTGGGAAREWKVLGDWRFRQTLAALIYPRGLLCVMFNTRRTFSLQTLYLPLPKLMLINSTFIDSLTEQSIIPLVSQFVTNV